MSGPSITVNTYNDSITGHTNVTFRDANGNHLGTYGSNIEPGSSALPGSLGGVFAENPSRQPSYTHKLLLPEFAFNKALYFAQDMARQTAAHVGDYSPFLTNCYDFVDDVLQQAGLPEHSAKEFVEPGSIVHSYGVVKDLITNPLQSFHWHNLAADPSYGLPLYQYQIGHTISFMEYHDQAFDTPEGVLIKSTLHHVQYETSFSPIALDLDNDGFDIISVDSSQASFDYFNDGTQIRTSWIGPDDGFLVHDKNENGRIDNLSEMFGHKDVGVAFQQLSNYDSNGDKKVNEGDAEFLQLAIWRDANGDGITQDGELSTLKDLGVEELFLDSQLVKVKLGDSYVTERSTAKVNGNIIEMSDIHFRIDGLIPSGAVTDRGYAFLEDYQYSINRIDERSHIGGSYDFHIA